MRPFVQQCHRDLHLQPWKRAKVWRFVSHHYFLLLLFSHIREWLCEQLFTNTILQSFPGSYSHIAWSHHTLRNTDLTYFVSESVANCTSDQLYLKQLLSCYPGMSMSSQPGLLPARTEHWDGEEQERSAWSNSSQGVGTSKSKCHSNRARQKSLQRQAFYTEKCLGSDGSNQSLLMVVSVPSNCAAGS